MGEINRYLENKAMDNIDHALGRPLDPMGETYRNFYATGAPLADEMASSPLWVEGRPGRDMRYFTVTEEGRRALAKHLREIGDLHRAFAITFDGHTRIVVGKSRGNARYSHYLDVSEVMPDLNFKDYCRRASVARV